MQEIKYQTLAISSENGEALLLSYFLLAEEADGFTRYGVKITAGSTVSAVRDLTTDRGRALELMALLVRHTVTPVTLADVVADWL